MIEFIACMVVMGISGLLIYVSGVRLDSFAVSIYLLCCAVGLFGIVPYCVGIGIVFLFSTGVTFVWSVIVFILSCVLRLLRVCFKANNKPSIVRYTVNIISNMFGYHKEEE